MTKTSNKDQICKKKTFGTEIVIFMEYRQKNIAKPSNKDQICKKNLVGSKFPKSATLMDRKYQNTILLCFIYYNS